MHKKIVLVIFCLLLLSGCKKINDNDDYIEKVYNCLNEKSITNEVALGYKYYLPKGVRKIKDYDYNQVFLIDDCYLYLYVDIISFFHGEELQKPLDVLGYYETFDYNGKKGYILIEEQNEQYYFSIVYNYSKIEGYTSKEDINKMITLSSIILNSIEYNQTVIEKILEGDLGQFSEFTYEVDKPEGASSNFSQYLEEYVQRDEEVEQLPGE